MKQLKVLRVVVASPSDVHSERKCLEEVVAELNRGIARNQGLHIEFSRWEIDAYPGFHVEGPQGLIDQVLRIEDCDVLIGIFWKRFGTPTSDASSGTEHEFKKAYEAWKLKKSPQIMMYFNEKPAYPKTKAETDQWGLVLDLKHRFPQEGLWWTYNGKAQFEKLVRQHLTQFILRIPQAHESEKPQPATLPSTSTLKQWAVNLPSPVKNAQLPSQTRQWTTSKPTSIINVKSKANAHQFKAGDAVRHNTFGEGTILNSELVQGTEFVDVQFHGKHGKKRLSLDFAKLEKI